MNNNFLKIAAVLFIAFVTLISCSKDAIENQAITKQAFMDEVADLTGYELSNASVSIGKVSDSIFAADGYSLPTTADDNGYVAFISIDAEKEVEGITDVLSVSKSVNGIDQPITYVIVQHVPSNKRMKLKLDFLPRIFFWNSYCSVLKIPDYVIITFDIISPPLSNYEI